MNPLTPYLSAIKAGALIAMLAGSGWLGWEWRDRSAEADANRKLAESAAAETAAVERARALERDSAERINRLAEAYEQDKRNREESHANDLARLATGADRLRAHWQGCKATADLSGYAASAALADAAEQLRRKDTADLIGIGREADAKERALQQFGREVSR